jgi:hypothetical protein
MKNIIKTILIFGIFSNQVMADETSWEFKLIPSFEKAKATQDTPKYNSSSLTTALGYNKNNDQIEFALSTSQANSPINETSSSIGLGYEKYLGEYNNISSTLKFSVARYFSAGQHDNSYSIEPKLIYKGNGFEPFISFNYSKSFNGGDSAKEYALGAKFEVSDLAVQPTFFTIKEGVDKSNGFRLEIVKSF